MQFQDIVQIHLWASKLVLQLTLQRIGWSQPAWWVHCVTSTSWNGGVPSADPQAAVWGKCQPHVHAAAADPLQRLQGQQHLSKQLQLVTKSQHSISNYTCRLIHAASDVQIGECARLCLTWLHAEGAADSITSPAWVWSTADTACRLEKAQWQALSMLTCLVVVGGCIWWQNQACSQWPVLLASASMLWPWKSTMSYTVLGASWLQLLLAAMLLCCYAAMLIKAWQPNLLRTACQSNLTCDQ